MHVKVFFYYRVRFEDMTDGSTKILFQTDGMLLREAMVDPLLSRLIVIDFFCSLFYVIKKRITKLIL